MTKRSTSRSIIRSLDEIPPSFDSEDDERDWWAEHEFSTDLLSSMHPVWEDIDAIRPVRLRAIELAQVQFSISISRKHLSLIKRSEGKLPKARHYARLEHAAVSIVFSAAAAEAGLNLFLAAPVLFLEEDGLRRFFGSFVSRQAQRMTLEEKVDFAWSYCSSRPGPERAALLSLFERRDAIIHAMPYYCEPLTAGRASNSPGPNSRTIIAVNAGVSEGDVEAAFDYFEVAKSFLDALTLGTPESS